VPDPTLHGNSDPCPACELRRLIDYDPASGVFRWKAREARDFPGQPRRFEKWNTQFAGQIAGCIAKSTGYRVFSVKGKQLYAHRVAWLLHHERWPDGEIDHINRVRDDNRIDNLRDVSVALNARNRKRSETAGVYPTEHGTWSASVSTDAGRISLGTFRCQTAALIARRRGECEHGYVPLDSAEIVRRTVEEARRIYWPEWGGRVRA
jgi:hypothetical protein